MADSWRQRASGDEWAGHRLTGPDTKGTTSVGQRLRRWAVRAARTAYLGLERSRLAPLLHLPPVRRLKARVTYTPASRVLSVLDLLAATGVSCWVGGGWGVDALVGRQTRRHHDLDLVISDSDEEYRRLAEALAREGFRPDEPERSPGLPMPLRCAWHNDDGHTIEILPVALHGPPFQAAPTGGQPTAGAAPFASGLIDGRRVPCLSAGLQLALHEGYPPRDTDARDIGLLRTCVHPPERTMPA
jgi:lincosamide nucleotidyltransferase A/C/D/E